MNIKDDKIELIVKEFNYVAERMKNTNDPFEKMFFFSATYGVIQRVFNIEYDPILVYIHLILQATFERINSRLNAIMGGMERAIKIPDDVFDKLPELIMNLSDEITNKNPQGIHNKLLKIANLSYLTTGNGYYLYQKKEIEI